MKKEIIEGNCLLAEYMGLKYIDGKYILSTSHWDTYIQKYNPEDLQFHNSWHWLMPVVIEIESKTKYVFQINGLTCHILNGKYHELDVYMCNSKMESVWLCCVEFVKLHKDGKI